jgi:hypothetical protein
MEKITPGPKTWKQLFTLTRTTTRRTRLYRYLSAQMEIQSQVLKQYGRILMAIRLRTTSIRANRMPQLRKRALMQPQPPGLITCLIFSVSASTTILALISLSRLSISKASSLKTRNITTLSRTIDQMRLTSLTTLNLVEIVDSTRTMTIGFLGL